MLVSRGTCCSQSSSQVGLDISSATNKHASSQKFVNPFECLASSFEDWVEAECRSPASENDVSQQGIVPNAALKPSVNDIESIPQELERFLFSPINPVKIELQGLAIEHVRDVDPWSISVAARKKIFEQVRDLYRSICQHKFTTIINEMEDVFLDLNEIRMAEKANFLKTRDIIGATMTGLAKYRKVIQAVGCRVLILEV